MSLVNKYLHQERNGSKPGAMADLTDARVGTSQALGGMEPEVSSVAQGTPGLDGVLWILRTGAPWQDLPPRYGPYQTCHRRFQQWVRSGVHSAALCENLLLPLASLKRPRSLRFFPDNCKVFIYKSVAKRRPDAQKEMGRIVKVEQTKILPQIGAAGLSTSYHRERSIWLDLAK